MKLWNREPVSEALFKSLKFGDGWVDVVEDRVVNSEVHELNSELELNSLLILNCLLYDSAHLLNGVHLGLGGDLNPVVELLVHVDEALALELKFTQGPVANLDQTVTEDLLFNSDSFAHFLHVCRLLSCCFWLSILSSGTLLRWWGFSTFLICRCIGLNSSHIGHNLILKCLLQNSVEPWVAVVGDNSMVLALDDCLNSGHIVSLRGQLTGKWLGDLMSGLLLNCEVVVVQDLY